MAGKSFFFVLFITKVSTWQRGGPEDHEGGDGDAEWLYERIKRRFGEKAAIADYRRRPRHHRKHEREEMLNGATAPGREQTEGATAAAATPCLLRADVSLGLTIDICVSAPRFADIV